MTLFTRKNKGGNEMKKASSVFLILLSVTIIITCIFTHIEKQEKMKRNALLLYITFKKPLICKRELFGMVTSRRYVDEYIFKNNYIIDLFTANVYTLDECEPYNLKEGKEKRQK